MELMSSLRGWQLPWSVILCWMATVVTMVQTKVTSRPSKKKKGKRIGDQTIEKQIEDLVGFRSEICTTFVMQHIQTLEDFLLLIETHYWLKSYRSNTATNKKKRFNHAHAQLRNVIE